MGDLTTNFSMSEFLVSQTAARMGRELIPGKQEHNSLVQLARSLMQPIRELLGRPVVISSGYRPEWLNTKIGGSKTSQHMKGQAADFIVVGMPIPEACHKILDSDIEYDQLICEFDKWIHISFCPGGLRNEVLTAKSSDGTTVYYPGLDDLNG